MIFFIFTFIRGGGHQRDKRGGRTVCVVLRGMVKQRNAARGRRCSARLFYNIFAPTAIECYAGSHDSARRQEWTRVVHQFTWSGLSGRPHGELRLAPYQMKSDSRRLLTQRQVRRRWKVLITPRRICLQHLHGTGKLTV